ncbi:MAG TPA: transcriptional regulator [Terriglobales bacterium]|jgi:DNA-binding winged helix-turn-helix (wHTH) protein
MTATSAHSARRIFRFGVFEVDGEAGELRKSGVRVRLQEQPFQLLMLLLEHPGSVVGRQEIRDKLWPSDTFVDFDSSLNTAIAKLRDTLGDSAISPRYVETVPRRGYRFIAPVEVMEGSTVGVENQAKSQDAEANLHPQLRIPVPHRVLPRALFALIQVMYLVFYVEALLHLPQADRILSTFLPAWVSFTVFSVVLISAAIGIPFRLYLLSGAGFDYRNLGNTFHKLFPYVLILGQLWAVAPFLLTEKIGFGPAFAATAALLYVPFSERTLIRMAYPVQSQ